VTAFGVLADVATAIPCSFRNDFRDRAAHRCVSALAATRMARSSSRVMALIGNGAQSEFQVIAFHRMVGIRKCGSTTPIPRRRPNWFATYEAATPEPVGDRCNSARGARGADIITTVTADKRNATILTPLMIEPACIECRRR